MYLAKQYIHVPYHELGSATIISTTCNHCAPAAYSLVLEAAEALAALLVHRADVDELVLLARRDRAVTRHALAADQLVAVEALLADRAATADLATCARGRTTTHACTSRTSHTVTKAMFHGVIS